MPVGSSGRIVIEIDPLLKAELYDALEKEGLTLKDWFLRHVQEYLRNNVQLRLDFYEEELSRKTGS